MARVNLDSVSTLTMRRLAGLARVVAVLAWAITPPAAPAASATATAISSASANAAALLARRSGYGANASGGAAGPVVLVTSEADSGPGSLRAALERTNGPAWIRFARDMRIALASQIRVGSNLTIDGRGRKVTLLDHGLTLSGSRNVIIVNLAIDGRFTGIAQAINIANGSRDIWVDHVDLSRFNDRLVNVKTGSGEVTISWSKLHDHNKVMLLNNVTDRNLFANAERDSSSRVTLDHNWFVNTVQRNPRAQYGIYHLYNNLLEDWDSYGMSFSLGARALVENNIFANRADRPCTEPPAFVTIEGTDRNYCNEIRSAGTHAQLANGAADQRSFDATREKYGYTAAQSAKAALRVTGNLYLGSAREAIADTDEDRVPRPPYRYRAEIADAALADKIRKHAGNTL